MTLKNFSRSTFLASTISLCLLTPSNSISSSQFKDVKNLVRQESQTMQPEEASNQFYSKHKVTLDFKVMSEGKVISNPRITSSSPIIIGDANREFVATINIQKEALEEEYDDVLVTISTVTTVVKELKKGDKVTANSNYSYILKGVDKYGDAEFSIIHEGKVETLTASRGSFCSYGGSDDTNTTIYNLAKEGKVGKFRFVYQTGFQPIVTGETIDSGFSYKIIFEDIFKNQDPI